MQRFWEKVDVDHPTRCWLWLGYRNEDGYGRMMFRRRVTGAHRVSYELWHGHKPEGVVMHSCDVPACVNPYHLIDATQQANMRDAQSKGRLSPFPRRYKLTSDQVQAIRSRLDAGERPIDLAREFDVTDGMIGHIKSGRRRA